jgi:putative tryptophan/tyrosine transport system substrate-binding protein
MSATIFLLAIFAVSILAPFHQAEAQQPAKVAKIGWLGTRPASGSGSGAESFRREFSKLGYVDGKNMAFESRHADNKLDRLPALADELVRLQVDVLFHARN